MNNILAIAHKELRGYFNSPIAYIVIGLFALTYGYFFYALLLFFDRQSMQMAGMGAGQTLNVNEQLISPAFQNTMVVFLFILPMVTMRTYSEEKRSGTIELLLTAPLTDFMRGVIDTKHVVYYVSFIAFGLFLTARSVDTERWRG